MNPISQIRKRLGVTQAAMADGIGVSQGNVSFYERGQTMPPDVAKRLIGYAGQLGHTLTFDDVYGLEPVEKQKPIKQIAERRKAARRKTTNPK